MPWVCSPSFFTNPCRFSISESWEGQFSVLKSTEGNREQRLVVALKKYQYELSLLCRKSRSYPGKPSPYPERMQNSEGHLKRNFMGQDGKILLLSGLLVLSKLFAGLFSGWRLAESEEGIRLIHSAPCLQFLSSLRRAQS